MVTTSGLARTEIPLSGTWGSGLCAAVSNAPVVVPLVVVLLPVVVPVPVVELPVDVPVVELLVEPPVVVPLLVLEDVPLVLVLAVVELVLEVVVPVTVGVVGPPQAATNDATTNPTPPHRNIACMREILVRFSGVFAKSARIRPAGRQFVLLENQRDLKAQSPARVGIHVLIVRMHHVPEGLDVEVEGDLAEELQFPAARTERHDPLVAGGLLPVGGDDG
jgi:hypothetical protein